MLRKMLMSLVVFCVFGCKTSDRQNSDLQEAEVQSRFFCLVTSTLEAEVAAPALVECTSLEDSEQSWSGYLHGDVKPLRLVYSAKDSAGEELGVVVAAGESKNLRQLIRLGEGAGEWADRLGKLQQESEFEWTEVASLHLISLTLDQATEIYDSPDMSGFVFALGGDHSAREVTSSQMSLKVVAYPDIPGSYALKVGSEVPTGEYFYALYKKADKAVAEELSRIAEHDFKRSLEEMSDAERRQRRFVLYWHDRGELENLVESLNILIAEKK